MLVDVRRYRSLSRRDRTLQDSCDVEELENCPSTPPLAVFLSSEDITSTIFPLRHATSEPASSRSRAPFNSSPLSARNSPAVGCKSVRVRWSKRGKDRRPFSECFGTALAEKLTGTLGTLTLTRARTTTGTLIYRSVDISTMLIPMTYAAETGVRNRLRFLAPVFGAGFSCHMRMDENLCLVLCIALDRQ